MEHRSQKAAVRMMMLAVALGVAPGAWSQDLEFEVRHERLLRDHPGRVVFGERSVEYQQVLTEKQQAKVERGKKPPKLESARWDYQDIQQLWLSPEKLVIVTYKDRPWLLGVDKEFEFYLTGKGQAFTTAYEFLKDKLDQRFVAALPDPKVSPVWELPARLLGTLRGSEGMLQVGSDRIVFKTDRKGQSRTWRLEDIDNVSTSGPSQLTLTTYERAKAHYGGMKGFNFQLKQKLNEEHFDRLWKRLNREKGLDFLTSLQERSQATQ
jgi:hypothetical protein